MESNVKSCFFSTDQTCTSWSLFETGPVPYFTNIYWQGIHWGGLTGSYKCFVGDTGDIASRNNPAPIQAEDTHVIASRSDATLVQAKDSHNIASHSDHTLTQAEAANKATTELIPKQQPTEATTSSWDNPLQTVLMWCRQPNYLDCIYPVVTDNGCYSVC
jgi:hypothetical protein